MGKLMSPLKISGSVDELCFRQTEDGVVVQKKPGPTAEQVRTGETFDLTRRNAREFGRVTKDAMLLRKALSIDMLYALRHSKLNSHMNKRVYRVAMSDKKSRYGFRHADAGNLQLLEGFDYNHLLSVDTALPVQLEHIMDVVTGNIQIAVPSCIVRRKKTFPKGATHFRIVSFASAVDFNKQSYSSNVVESELLPLSKKMTPLQLQHCLQAQPGQVMLHTAGIVFYKTEDGEAILLRCGALKIVQVARKEKVVTPGTGTPTLAAMPHTCASEELLLRVEKTDQLVTVGLTDAKGLPLRSREKPLKQPRFRKHCKKPGYISLMRTS